MSAWTSICIHCVGSLECGEDFFALLRIALGFSKVVSSGSWMEKHVCVFFHKCTFWIISLLWIRVACSLPDVHKFINLISSLCGEDFHVVKSSCVRNFVTFLYHYKKSTREGAIRRCPVVTLHLCYVVMIATYQVPMTYWHSTRLQGTVCTLCHLFPLWNPHVNHARQLLFFPFYRKKTKTPESWNGFFLRVSQLVIA